MSEFRIIKCPKCDAALTEVDGNKLKKCVQCGHSFGLKIENKPSVLNTIRKNNKTINTSTASRSKKSKSKSNSTTAIPKKNKSIVATIVKWYVIIAVSLGMLSKYFK